MDEYKYLILAKVDESPFLVLTDSTPPKDGFVTFNDGAGLRVGEIIESCFVSEASNEYSMFAMLYPIFDAEKIYSCCYTREEAG